MRTSTQITFNFTRLAGDEVQENFTMTFSNDGEDLDLMLHNMRLFLDAMTFVVDNKVLELVEK